MFQINIHLINTSNSMIYTTIKLRSVAMLDVTLIQEGNSSVNTK